MDVTGMKFIGINGSSLSTAFCRSGIVLLNPDTQKCCHYTGRDNVSWYDMDEIIEMDGNSLTLMSTVEDATDGSVAILVYDKLLAEAEVTLDFFDKVSQWHSKMVFNTREQAEHQLFVAYVSTDISIEMGDKIARLLIQRAKTLAGNNLYEQASDKAFIGLLSGYSKEVRLEGHILYGKLCQLLNRHDMAKNSYRLFVRQEFPDVTIEKYQELMDNYNLSN